MYKALLATHRRIVFFNLIGDIIWTPTEFLLRLIPEAEKILDKKLILNVALAKTTLMDKQADSLFLIKEVQKAQENIQEWKNEIKNQLEGNNSTDSDIMNRCMWVLKVYIIKNLHILRFRALKLQTISHVW